jgi:threonine aldolase
MAARLEAAITELPGVVLLFPRQANAVFAELPLKAIDALRSKGWLFYTFIGAGGCRFMCSWDTRPEDVDAFAGDLRAALAAAAGAE